MRAMYLLNSYITDTKQLWINIFIYIICNNEINCHWAENSWFTILFRHSFRIPLTWKLNVYDSFLTSYFMDTVRYFASICFNSCFERLVWVIFVKWVFFTEESKLFWAFYTFQFFSYKLYCKFWKWCLLKWKHNKLNEECRCRWIGKKLN